MGLVRQYDKTESLSGNITENNSACRSVVLMINTWVKTQAGLKTRVFFERIYWTLHT